MVGDPAAVTDPLQDAIDAFERMGRGQPTNEVGIESTDNTNRENDWKIQLTKACQLLNAARTLTEQNGYYTATIELCFGAMERSIEAYLIDATGDTVEEAGEHRTIYDRAGAVGLFTRDTADELLALYENRASSYYANWVPTDHQCEAMFALAPAVHDHAAELIGDLHDCNFSK